MSQISKTTRKKRQKHTTTRRRAIKNGYRSGLEDKTATCIAKSGCIVLFETDKIDYVVPARDAKYTPDFKLPKKGGFFLCRDERHLDSPRSSKASTDQRATSRHRYTLRVL